MSIIDYQHIEPYRLNYNDFKLAIKNSGNQVNIMMLVEKHLLNTSILPQTYFILKSNLPQVLSSLCFNASDLPFDIEVKNTEIGHLFEHILLEYLCEDKIKKGYTKVSFKGVTNWNWKIDEKGTFHIQIEIEPEDINFFHDSLERSVLLLNKILASKDVLKN